MNQANEFAVLVAGLALSLAALAAKVGLGLEVARSGARGVARWLALHVVIFAAVAALSERAPTALERLAASGALSGFMAVALWTWSIALLRLRVPGEDAPARVRSAAGSTGARSADVAADPSRPHRSAWPWLLPCPLSLIAVALTTAMVKKSTGFAGVLIGLGLGLAFAALALGFWLMRTRRLSAAVALGSSSLGHEAESGSRTRASQGAETTPASVRLSLVMAVLGLSFVAVSFAPATFEEVVGTRGTGGVKTLETFAVLALLAAAALVGAFTGRRKRAGG